MNTEYHRNLGYLKSTFDEASEVEVLINAIASFFPKGNITILDVGIGEGQSSFKVLRQLVQLGYSVQMTGIDPCLSPSLVDSNVEGVDLRQMYFSELPITERFDVVVATQSLYYLGDLEFALAKLLQHLETNGTLLITTWTDSCFLYALHNLFTSQPPTYRTTSQNVEEILRDLTKDSQISVAYTSGNVDVTKWLESDKICRAAFMILNRSVNSEPLVPNQYKYFREYLTKQPPLVYRENGTVILRQVG